MGRLEGLIWLMQFTCQKTTTIKCEKIQINNLSRPSTVYSASICPPKNTYKEENRTFNDKYRHIYKYKGN